MSVDQREDCLDHLGNHLPPYTTIRLHRHNIFKRGLIAVFKELFTIFSDLQSPWIIVGPLQRVRPRNGILALVLVLVPLRSEFIGEL